MNSAWQLVGKVVGDAGTNSDARDACELESNRELIPTAAVRCIGGGVAADKAFEEDDVSGANAAEGHFVVLHVRPRQEEISGIIGLVEDIATEELAGVDEVGLAGSLV